MRNTRWVLIGLSLAVLSGCGILGPGDLDELADNRRLWEAAGLIDYEYMVTRGCFCGFAGRALVEVRSGVVTRVFHLETDQELEPPFSDPFTTVDGVFDLVEEALREADEVSVTYDSQMGFPREVSIDYIKDAVDDELALTLATPTPL